MPAGHRNVHGCFRLLQPKRPGRSKSVRWQAGSGSRNFSGTRGVVRVTGIRHIGRCQAPGGRGSDVARPLLGINSVWSGRPWRGAGRYALASYGLGGGGGGPGPEACLGVFRGLGMVFAVWRAVVVGSEEWTPFAVGVDVLLTAYLLSNLTLGVAGATRPGFSPARIPNARDSDYPTYMLIDEPQNPY